MQTPKPGLAGALDRLNYRGIDRLKTLGVGDEKDCKDYLDPIMDRLKG